MALAKAERERRSARQLRSERRLGLAPLEPLAEALPRMAIEQVELTLELLAGEQQLADSETVHETRKAIKRLRALLRLLEHQLGEKEYAREAGALRDAARLLSGARDAEVMLSTLDALVARHPRTLARRRGVLELRGRLLAEQARIERRTLGDPATRAAMVRELRAFRIRVSHWELPNRQGIELVERDLARVYGQGRKRHQRVLRGKGQQAVAMHEWRKRVKDLRHAAEMLQRRNSRKRARGRSGHQADQRLRKLAKRADDLGELLGEDHDLVVLAQHLRSSGRNHGEQTWRTGRRTRKALLNAVAKRRRTLRRRALRQGAQLYRRRPKAFVRRLRSRREKL